MKFLLVLLFCCSVNAQYTTKYDRSGRLTGIFNLTEPANCGRVRLAGPVREIREPSPTGFAYFTVRNQDIELEVTKLSNVDRANLYHHLIKPGRRVEVTGYACGSNGVVDPVSIKLR